MSLLDALSLYVPKSVTIAKKKKLITSPMNVWLTLLCWAKISAPVSKNLRVYTMSSQNYSCESYEPHRKSISC